MRFVSALSYHLIPNFATKYAIRGGEGEEAKATGDRVLISLLEKLSFGVSAIRRNDKPMFYRTDVLRFHFFFFFFFPPPASLPESAPTCFHWNVRLSTDNRCTHPNRAKSFIQLIILLGLDSCTLQSCQPSYSLGCSPSFQDDTLHIHRRIMATPPLCTLIEIASITSHCCTWKNQIQSLSCHH